MRYKENTILTIGDKYDGRELKNIPASYLLHLYNEVPDLPKKLVVWMEVNMDDIEKCAGSGEDATLFTFYDIK